MLSINDTQDRATKLLISMGIALLITMAVLVLDNLVIRDTPDIPEANTAIEKSSKGNIGIAPVQVIPPVQQKKFYR